MTDVIETIDALEALYGEPVLTAKRKVIPEHSPLYRKWISASRFVVVSTVGPDGVDGSPRGDDGPVVRIQDDTTLWLPDWMGNNRVDTLRNIVRDGRIALMFMVTGSNNVVRVNGRATLTISSEVLSQFEKHGKHPRSVAIVEIEEVYFQCAKAVMRSGLWTRKGDAEGLPTAGAFVKDREASFDAES